MNQRECRQFKATKDLTPTNFSFDSMRGKEGYRVTCKSCELMRREELYEGDKSAQESITLFPTVFSSLAHDFQGSLQGSKTVRKSVSSEHG
jgi:hypothetical protein